ncbi:MAG: hypothetical protein ABW189_08715 [Rickettsiales bacterium]
MRFSYFAITVGWLASMMRSGSWSICLSAAAIFCFADFSADDACLPCAQQEVSDLPQSLHTRKPRNGKSSLMSFRAGALAWPLRRSCIFS